MKYIYLLPLLFFALLFQYACEPMEDVYSELDKQRVPFNDAVTITVEDGDYSFFHDEYLKDNTTPEDTAYAKILKSQKCFSEDYNPGDFLPAFLSDEFKALGLNSSVQVSYQYDLGELDYLEELTKVMFYELSADDYDNMGAPGKYNNFSSYDEPEDYLPDFLLNKYSGASSGDVVLIKYVYYADGASSTRGDLYEFDGSAWTLSSKEIDLPEGVKAYTLSADDYESMGFDNPNFSNSAKPEAYLPQFLSLMAPYAQEGDKYAIVYNYYDDTEAIEYTKTGGEWIAYDSKVIKTDPYVNSTKGWVFDPTISFNMTKEDYQYILDYVINSIENGSNYVDEKYKNVEYYYGANTYYKNFDLRISNRSKDKYNVPLTSDEANEYGKEFIWELDEENAIEVMNARMQEAIEIMLTLKYPDSPAKVDGVDLFYRVSVSTYENDLTRKLPDFTFQCIKAGPNAEFKFISREDK